LGRPPLKTYLDRVAEDPFEWGTHDCALFAAACVAAMTGMDFAETYRGKYNSARGAATALGELGAGTLLMNPLIQMIPKVGLRSR